MRARITVFAAAVALAAATALAPVPVQARPGVAFGPVDLCMKIQPGLCITGHGAGVQVTVQDYGDGNTAYTSSNVGSYVELSASGSGRCLREDSNTAVVDEGGGCQSSDTREEWSVSGPSNDMSFTNRATGDLLITNAAGAGQKVWGGNSSGDWHWVQAAP